LAFTARARWRDRLLPSQLQQLALPCTSIVVSGVHALRTHGLLSVFPPSTCRCRYSRASVPATAGIAGCAPAPHDFEPPPEPTPIARFRSCTVRCPARSVRPAPDATKSSTASEKDWRAPEWKFARLWLRFRVSGRVPGGSCSCCTGSGATRPGPFGLWLRDRGLWLRPAGELWRGRARRLRCIQAAALSSTD